MFMPVYAGKSPVETTNTSSFSSSGRFSNESSPWGLERFDMAFFPKHLLIVFWSGLGRSGTSKTVSSLLVLLL
jgi:hypothetical protein